MYGGCTAVQNTKGHSQATKRATYVYCTITTAKDGWRARTNANATQETHEKQKLKLAYSSAALLLLLLVR